MVLNYHISSSAKEENDLDSLVAVDSDKVIYEKDGIDVETKKILLQRIRDTKYRKLKKNKKQKTVINTANLIKLIEKYDITEDSYQNKEDNTSDFVILGSRIGKGIKSDPFYLVFSSKTLLRNAEKQERLNDSIGLLGIDATYKINLLNFPLIVLGTQDLGHTPFPIAFALICNHENGEAYTFVLDCLKQGLKYYLDFITILNISLLMGLLRFITESIQCLIMFLL